LSAPLPKELIRSLEGVAGFNEDNFRKIHEPANEPVSIRINRKKRAHVNDEVIAEDAALSPKNVNEKVAWCETGFYLKKRPSFTFDPLFHAGVYYVQEASSMFLEQALKQNVDLSKGLKILDLCAAPGGKSTHIQSLISQDSILVSNEVIRPRVSILEENLTKWGGVNTIITQNDPHSFQKLSGYFDVLVVDAPCSGSGLFRREPETIREWSPETVKLCSQRQQRILSDILPSLKSHGLLIYSTCSYSPEENEDIVDWLINEFQLETISLSIPAEWGIIESRTKKANAFGYRFYPDKLKGEGLFLACLKKPALETMKTKFPRKNPDSISKPEKDAIRKWIEDESALDFFKHKESIHALPANQIGLLALMQRELFIKRAGIILGRLSGAELIPHHGLALSNLCSKNIEAVDLDFMQSIAYLRRDELKIESNSSGWALVRHNGINLGWLKFLGRRVNNYYPMDWRILKERKI
jgi:16S rRNA C967 or C1407 C5-methylase (RsmB/RsmF family)/NOL1/NOP2/fmu family ribosome biogenesis protein